MLRTAQDIRAPRSVPTRAGPVDDQAAYARLSQLASERRQVSGEHEQSQRKLDRAAKRLAEIDEQMSRLRGQVGELPRGPGQQPASRAWREVEFRY